jgi:hypothetical protein
LTHFGSDLKGADLRAKVIALVPAFHKLRDLGSSLIPKVEAASARDRIIAYLQRYPKVVVDGDELMVVSGIAEWARRLRELRVQYGWAIYSGVTFHDIADEAQDAGSVPELAELETVLGLHPSRIKPDQYVLMREEQDRNAAYRWNVLNEIRRSKHGVREKFIEYFRRNVGEQVTGEELRYLAGDTSAWPRRVRELRTEFGWPIVTRSSGRTDLPIGVYMLELDRQAHEHDRKIPDPVRVEVLRRDKYRCVICGWSRSDLTPDDPRKMLELHHVKHHAAKGENTPENLITLCNVHHDEEHRSQKHRR